MKMVKIQAMGFLLRKEIFPIIRNKAKDVLNLVIILFIMESEEQSQIFFFFNIYFTEIICTIDR